MTPLQIQMMLHYYTRNEPYAVREPAHANSGAVHTQRLCLITDEMLTTDPTSDSCFKVTERGHAYVDALMGLPLPIKKWVMPDADYRASNKGA